MAARKKKATRKKATRKKATRKKARAPRATKRKPGKGSKGGRPKFVYDKHTIDCLTLLAAAHNSIEDAARIVGVSKSTLERELADKTTKVHKAWNFGLSHRRNNLRVAQFQNALGGDTVMQIFLGKNELGQHNFKQVEITGAEGGPIEIGDTSEMLTILFQKMLEQKRSRRKVKIDLPE